MSFTSEHVSKKFEFTRQAFKQTFKRAEIKCGEIELIGLCSYLRMCFIFSIEHATSIGSSGCHGYTPGPDNSCQGRNADTES